MPVPILLYHHIASPPPGGVPSRSNYVCSENFARQMRLLKALGYHGLSLKEAIPYIQKKRGKGAAITFDDGLISVYQQVMPILDNAGFTATIFL